MKVEDLLVIKPAELAALSDADLADRLAPLIPQSRALYVGPRTATVQVGEVRIPKSAWAKKQKMMDQVLAQLQAQQSPPK